MQERPLIMRSAAFYVVCMRKSGSGTRLGAGFDAGTRRPAISLHRRMFATTRSQTRAPILTLSPWILIASQPTSAQSSIHRIAPWPKNILEHCVQSHWKDAPSLAVWAETSISVPAKPDRIYAKCDEWIRLAAT